MTSSDTIAALKAIKDELLVHCRPAHITHAIDTNIAALITQLEQAAPVIRDERYKRGYDDGYDAAKAEEVDIEAGARAIAKLFSNVPFDFLSENIKQSYFSAARACAEAWGKKRRG